LFPAIRAKDNDWEIAVMGVSCRQQVEDGTGRKARHLVEVLADALPLNNLPRLNYSDGEDYSTAQN